MTFLRRLAQIREALKGELIIDSTARGMFRKDFNFIKACALDKAYCKEHKEIYEQVCSYVTLGDINPDIEGEQASLVEGEYVSTSIGLGLDPAKDQLFKRVLEDGPK